MRRFSPLVPCLVLAVAACAPVPRQGEAERKSELAIRMLLAALETADTTVVEDLFWPEATYDDFPNQITYQGIGEIVGYVTSVHTWGDDVYMNVGRVHAFENGAVAEWVFSAVQNRPIGTALPESTGREVVLNGVTIIELDGERIVRAADYTDTAPMWLQLGGHIELPGGGTIELEGPGN